MLSRPGFDAAAFSAKQTLMKLYYLPGACSLVTQITMEWMGQPYELQKVERSELRSPDFLALNPVGSVPVLTDDDLTLTQSNAILEYLTELHPDARLHGETAQERAEVRRWLSLCNADIHRNFGIVFGVQSYIDDPESQKQLTEKAGNRLVFLFAIVDKHLANREWLSARRSIADPYLYVLLRWAKDKDLDMSGMANLERFYQRMGSDPGVQASLMAQGLN
jgi:glutathione S-transferase